MDKQQQLRNETDKSLVEIFGALVKIHESYVRLQEELITGRGAAATQMKVIEQAAVTLYPWLADEIKKKEALFVVESRANVLEMPRQLS